MDSVEPLLINDVARAPEFHEIPAVTVFQMRSYIGVPIILSTGRVYGTLCALDRDAAQNTQRDLDYLMLLARLLASQLDRRDLGILEERNRLAREIHDTLAQSLSALVLDLSAHAADLLKSAPELLPDAEGMRLLAQETLREVRRSIWSLQPGQLDGRTISEALKAEAAGLQRFGISATLEVRGVPGALPPAVETALLRIAQEALANVRKHAQADTALVGLTFGEHDLELRIDDNGRGLPEEAVAPSVDGGFGLGSMRERARGIGGELVIQPRPGGGTSLLCSVPRSGQATPAPPAPAAPARAPVHAAGGVTVGIVDDHTLVREGLRRLLTDVPGITITLEAGDGEAGLEQVRRNPPDVLLLDMQMPKLNGLQLLERLRDLGLPTRVIILTTFSQDEMIYQAMRQGARGYLLKETTGQELQDAVFVVARGGTLLTPVAAGRLADRLHARDALTEREREVLALLVEGLRDKETAARLGTSVKTVQFHVSNILGKLGARSRAEAVRIAIDRGLLVAM